MEFLASSFFFYRQTHSAFFRLQRAPSFQAFTRVLRPLIRFSSSHKAARNAIDPRLVASSVNHGAAGEGKQELSSAERLGETLVRVLPSDEWAEERKFLMDQVKALKIRTFFSAVRNVLLVVRVSQHNQPS